MCKSQRASKDWELLSNDEKAYQTLKLIVYGVTFCPADAPIVRMLRLTFSPPIYPTYLNFILPVLRLLRTEGRGAEAVQLLYSRRKDGSTLLSLEEAGAIYARVCRAVEDSLPCMPVVPTYARVLPTPEPGETPLVGPRTFGLVRQ